eukprot:2852639-Lingulodinium_polyedra.AAC.1
MKPLPRAKVLDGVCQLGEYLPQVRVARLTEQDATRHVRGVCRMASALCGEVSPQIAHLLEVQRFHD